MPKVARCHGPGGMLGPRPTTVQLLATLVAVILGTQPLMAAGVAASGGRSRGRDRGSRARSARGPPEAAFTSTNPSCVDPLTGQQLNVSISFILQKVTST